MVALGFAFALGLGMMIDRELLLNGIPSDSTEDFQLMSQAWNLIDHYYVDRGAVRHMAMTYGAISGMTEALGDTNHSVYLSPVQAKKAGSAVQGKLVGIGVEIKTKDHQAVVVAPMEGSPAQRAGIHPGDVIMGINGHDISGMSIAQISSRMAGEPGQPVVLTVSSTQDHQKHEIRVQRATIKLNNVSWQLLPGTDIAHVRIAMFSEGEAADLRNALLALQKAGAKKVILDVRNNPGGALDEAIGTASQFLSSGNVLWEKDATGRIAPIPVQPGGVATNVPLAVLINGVSASDSEIVAGALHDGKRGVLIGEKTYGTGTVLSEFTLSDGSALLLAVEEWLTPNLRSFWHRGIEPDIRVPLRPPNAILTPSAEREMTAGDLRSSSDVQLLRAIDTLSKEHSKL